MPRAMPHRQYTSADARPELLTTANYGIRQVPYTALQRCMPFMFLRDSVSAQ